MIEIFEAILVALGTQLLLWLFREFGRRIQHAVVAQW